jgi:hypothetical protein
LLLFLNSSGVKRDPCMYVCIRGGLLQPLHLDPQWSIVLNPYDR